MKKAYGYVRYSSHNQDDGWSIEAQKEAIEKYAKEKEIKIVKYFEDKAKTGRNTNRNGYQNMIKAFQSNNNDVKTLLVHKLDRLNRSQYDFFTIVKQFSKLNVKLIATADNIDTSNTSDMLIASIQSALAEQFSLNLSKETSKGLLAAAKEGFHCGGTPPLGFKVGQDQKLEIDETTVPAIRMIFEMYLNDMGYTATKKWLHDNNYKTSKGNDFSKSAINSILHNEKYAGIYTYNKVSAKDEDGKRNSHKYKEDYIRIIGGCPAIIKQEDFDKAQEKLHNRSNKTKSYNSKNYYMLNGLVYGEDKKLRYSGNINYSNGNKYMQYRSSENDGSKSVRADKLNDAVLFTIRELLMSEDKENDILHALNDYVATYNSELNVDIKKLKSKKVSLENSRENLFNALESGKVKDSILNRIEEIETEIKNIESKIQNSMSEQHKFTLDDIHDLKNQFIPYMASNNTLNARELLNSVLKHVIIGDEEIQIKFHNSISINEEIETFFKATA